MEAMGPIAKDDKYKKISTSPVNSVIASDTFTQVHVAG